jgi:hypothetical protein
MGLQDFLKALRGKLPQERPRMQNTGGMDEAVKLS